MAKTINAVIDRLFLLFFLLVICFGIYVITDSYYVRHISSGDAFRVFRPDEDNAGTYTNLSDEAVGWITIDDTNIDYPIMQASDNIKYLDTAPDGSYSLSGSIFLDSMCDPKFRMPFSLIYGHHMAKQQMFGALDAFADRTYFDTHKNATLTFDNTMHRAEVFAFMTCDADRKIIFDPSHESGQYEYIKNNAEFFCEPADSEKIVALSTCKDSGSTVRTVLLLSFTG